MIKELVQGAVKGAAGWVGNLVAGPKGAAVGVSIADSLMSKTKFIFFLIFFE